MFIYALVKPKKRYFEMVSIDRILFSASSTYFSCESSLPSSEAHLYCILIALGISSGSLVLRSPKEPQNTEVSIK